jgi:hypothetical protein
MAAGSRRDSSWWLGALTGEGRGGSTSGNRPMWLVRYQWNYLGNLLPFSQSALKWYESPHASLSFAAVNHRGPYTRYSSSGGGQLPGYNSGAEDQYDLEQFMQEWAYQSHGFSWQQEWHWKQINDSKNNTTQTATGYYVQLGTFPVTYIHGFPEKLEFAGRYAYYKPETTIDEYSGQEFALCLNWFFKSHRNKLTSEVAYLTMEENDIIQPGWRFRFQWDVSF